MPRNVDVFVGLFSVSTTYCIGLVWLVCFVHLFADACRCINGQQYEVLCSRKKRKENYQLEIKKEIIIVTTLAGYHTTPHTEYAVILKAIGLEHVTNDRPFSTKTVKSTVRTVSWRRCLAVALGHLHEEEPKSRTFELQYMNYGTNAIGSS